MLETDGIGKVQSMIPLEIREVIKGVTQKIIFIGTTEYLTAKSTVLRDSEKIEVKVITNETRDEGTECSQVIMTDGGIVIAI